MVTRRQAVLGTAAMLVAPWHAQAQALPISFGGVRMGVCLYDFRDLPHLSDQPRYLASLIAACVAVGAGLVEINANCLEPPNALPFAGIPRLWDAPLTGAQRDRFNAMSPAQLHEQREALRHWRLTTPPAHFTAIARQFTQAGLTPFSYVQTFTPDMSGAEIEAIFRQAHALGVRLLSTNQTKVEMAPHLAPFAQRHDMMIGFHNHTATQNPNEVASRDSLERLLSVSPRFGINFDVGHYTASDQDEMAFLRDHIARITHLHMKDRKRHLGPGTPWGEGDSPLREILLFLCDRRSTLPAIVEYEYAGQGSGVDETRRCLAFMRQVLEQNPLLSR
jgi:sugar phosphate isomerase/epimerase